MDKFKGMTDEELAMEYVRGSNKAFDVLLSRTQGKLFSYILFVVHDQELANDIFQETFVKAISKLHQHKYTTSGKFSAWLMCMAHNVIMDWYRDQKNMNIVEPAEGNDLSNLKSGDVLDMNIENQFVNDQVMKDVERMMNMLPPSQREVVYMRYYQELSFKEIAETTGVSINTSLGRMRYALINMRRMAKKHHVALQLETL